MCCDGTSARGKYYVKWLARREEPDCRAIGHACTALCVGNASQRRCGGGREEVGERCRWRHLPARWGVLGVALGRLKVGNQWWGIDIYFCKVFLEGADEDFLVDDV